jgi:8-oxo-dGTP diphosphatase
MTERVGGAILKNKKLLIVKRSKSENLFPEYWEIPGGALKKGENYQQALAREIMEEVGLRVRRIGVHYHTMQYRGVAEPHFICELEEGRIRLNPSEHTDFKWVQVKEELDTLTVSDEMRESIFKALELL